MTQYKTVGGTTYKKTGGSRSWKVVSTPSSSSSKSSSSSSSRSSSSSSSTYRGPTAAQKAAGTLAVGGSSSSRQASKDSARAAALVQSGMRGGQTAAEAAAQATKSVYGASSAQARAAAAKLALETAMKAAAVKVAAEKARMAVAEKARIAAATKLATEKAKLVAAKDKQIAAAKKAVMADLRKGIIGGVKVIKTPPSIQRTTHLPDSTRVDKFKTTPSLAGQPAAKYPTAKQTIEQKQKEVKTAYLKLQADASKLQTTRAQLGMYEARISKAPIKNGIFVGTEGQYKKYTTDFKLYDTKFNQVKKQISQYETDMHNANIRVEHLGKLETKERRAGWGGLTGKIEDAEARIKASKYRTPTAAEASVPFDILRLTNKNVDTAMDIVDDLKSQRKTTTIRTGDKISEYSEPTMVAKATEFITAIPGGMVQGIHDKPLTATASLALGIATPPVLRGAGVAGKAIGLGARSAKVGKGVLMGVGGVYAVDVAGRTVVDLPASIEQRKYISKGLSPDEMGQVAGSIMSTELIPLGVGGVISTRGPRVVKTATKSVKAKIAKGKALTVKEIEAQMNAIAIISNIGMVGGPKLKIKTKIREPPLRTKVDTTKTYEEFMAGKATQTKTLQASVSRSKAKSAAERQRVAALKAKRDKVPGVAKSSSKTAAYREQLKTAGYHEPSRVYPKPKKTSYTTVLKDPQAEIAKYRLRQALVDKRYKRGIIDKAVHSKQTRELKAKIAEIKEFYTGAYKPPIKVRKTKTKRPVTTATAFSAAAMVSLITGTNAEMSAKSTPAVKSAIKPKQKLAQRIATQPKSKTLMPTKNALETVVEGTTVKPTPKTTKKVTTMKPRPTTKAVMPKPPLVVLPGVPIIHRKKKSIKQQGTQTIVYTPTQMINRVATLKSLFG